MDGTGFFSDLVEGGIFAQDFSAPQFSAPAQDGIVYVEDFDAPAEAKPPPPPEAPPPGFTGADIEAAYRSGRDEGHQEALRDALLIQAQLQAAAAQALADALGANRAAIERVALRQAEAAARLALAALAAALPRTMQDHAAAELQAVVAALLPGLRGEPDLRVRAHPEQADALRAILASQLDGTHTVLSVAADAGLPPGDVAIAWAEGEARRDTALIYEQIRAALAPLNLPRFEDIGRGQ